MVTAIFSNFSYCQLRFKIKINFLSKKQPTYLHHEQNGVQDDQGHDDVLKASADNQFPDTIFERVFVLWHISLTGPSCDGEVDAAFLILIQVALFQFLLT